MKHENESLSGSMAKGIPVNPTAAPVKRVLSATAPNANVMEQYKIFTICKYFYTYHFYSH